MPLWKTHRWSLYAIAIWQINESEAELALGYSLSEREALKLASCKNPVRRCEFWALRRALDCLLGYLPEVHYDENGKPYLSEGPFISFSHTASFAAVAVSERLPIGLDIETYRPNMLRVAPRFLRPSERQAVPEDKKLPYYTAYWSAKEALLKISGDRCLDFIRDIRVSPFVLGQVSLSRALIAQKPEAYQLLIWSSKSYTMCLAYAVKA